VSSAWWSCILVYKSLLTYCWALDITVVIHCHGLALILKHCDYRDDDEADTSTILNLRYIWNEAFCIQSVILIFFVSIYFHSLLFWYILNDWPFTIVMKPVHCFIWHSLKLTMRGIRPDEVVLLFDDDAVTSFSVVSPTLHCHCILTVWWWCGGRAKSFCIVLFWLSDMTAEEEILKSIRHQCLNAVEKWLCVWLLYYYSVFCVCVSITCSNSLLTYYYCLIVCVCVSCL